VLQIGKAKDLSVPVRIFMQKVVLTEINTIENTKQHHTTVQYLQFKAREQPLKFLTSDIFTKLISIKKFYTANVVK
jgi:hypothetical protein